MMISTAVVYGSTSGMTEQAAAKIAEMLKADLINVAEADPTKLAEYGALILGSSTWGSGALQDDWEFFLPKLQSMDLRGKKVAVFGTGDSIAFEDTFAQALCTLRDAAAHCGAQIIGACPIEGYGPVSSDVLQNGMFVGLALDSANQPDLTEGRISNWVSLLQKELN